MGGGGEIPIVKMLEGGGERGEGERGNGGYLGVQKR